MIVQSYLSKEFMSQVFNDHVFPQTFEKPIHLDQILGLAVWKIWRGICLFIADLNGHNQFFLENYNLPKSLISRIFASYRFFKILKSNGYISVLK